MTTADISKNLPELTGGQIAMVQRWLLDAKMSSSSGLLRASYEMRISELEAQLEIVNNFAALMQQLQASQGEGEA